jgi:NUMOD4 motif/HNH endonuclease
MKERWKAVVGFEGLYEVSDRGRVRSIGRLEVITRIQFGKKDTHSRVRKGGLISVKENSRGYRVVTLWKNGKAYFPFVHQLVLAAFVGRRVKNSVSRHLDGNCRNNSPTNLAWGSQKDNVADSIEHGTWTHGIAHGMAKNNDEIVREIRRSEDSQRVIAARYGISQGAVWQIRSGKTWKHVDA